MSWLDHQPSSMEQLQKHQDLGNKFTDKIGRCPMLSRTESTYRNYGQSPRWYLLTPLEIYHDFLIKIISNGASKIAISNKRIEGIDDKNMTFKYKDYRQNEAKKQMVLSHGEFIRRFALHILPKRFVKIRHYGFLSSIPIRIGPGYGNAESFRICRRK